MKAGEDESGEGESGGGGEDESGHSVPRCRTGTFSLSEAQCASVDGCFPRNDSDNDGENDGENDGDNDNDDDSDGDGDGEEVRREGFCLIGDS